NISVYDALGRLVFIGRDSDVQDDQTTDPKVLTSGSLGKLDPFVGPVQLQSANPGQSNTYYVAVSSDRLLPEVLDQTYNPTPTDPNVRLEPIDAVARVADDHLASLINNRTTSSGTAEFPDNVYISPTTGLPTSTLINANTVQSLKANVRPFTLG